MIHSRQSAIAPIMPRMQSPMQETMPAMQEKMIPMLVKSGRCVLLTKSPPLYMLHQDIISQRSPWKLNRVTELRGVSLP